MDINNKDFYDMEIADVEKVSKEDRIRYAGILMGYYDSICSLCPLDYKSNIIQTLVGLVYDLICDIKICHIDCEIEFFPEDFAEEHIEILHIKKNELIEDYGIDGFKFLCNSISYFGETNKLM